MITVNEYLMGRDKDFPLDILMLRNMAELLSRVNHMVATLQWDPRVTSGYRPSAINKTIGGAKMSTHTVCAGIDLADPDGKWGSYLRKNPSILEKYDLYLEHPDHTKGWVHLDTRKRRNRIFIP